MVIIINIMVKISLCYCLHDMNTLASDVFEIYQLSIISIKINYLIYFNTKGKISPLLGICYLLRSC